MEAAARAAPLLGDWYLVVFASTHTTFRFPELQSLALLNGIPDLKYIYEEDEIVVKDGKLEKKGHKRVLESPSKEGEKEEAGDQAGAGGVRAASKQDYEQRNPFILVQLPNDDVARRIAERAVGVKEIVHMWAWAGNYDDLLRQALQPPKEALTPYIGQGVTFKVDVKRFGASLPREEATQLIHRLKVLPFQGKVNLDQPAHVVCLHEYYGRYHALRGGGPKKLYLGRRIAEGARDTIEKLSLKKRHYLGTTSMDAELSLIMANQALASSRSLILDPFVGTGSLLCSCAEFGAMVMGGDIDPRVLRGSEPGKSLLTNLQQYNLVPRLVDIVVHDSAACAVRPLPIFDAIVADPPYGIRAGARKIGMKEKSKERRAHRPDVQPIADFADHIPQTLPYDVPEVLTDLLAFAARTLVTGGRLVYWLPTTHEYKDSDLPTHPCLRIDANSEQILTWTWRRRLITMTKCAPYDPVAHADVRTSYNPEAPVAHANLYEKILAPGAGGKKEKKADKKARREAEKKAKQEKAVAAAAEEAGKPKK